MADDDQQPPEQRYWFPYWTSPPQPPPPAPRPALRPQPSRRDSRPAPLVAPSPSRRPSQPPAATPTAAAAAASRGAGATSPQAQPQPTRLSSRPSPSLAPPLAPIREPNASAAPAPTAIAKEPKPPTKPATPPHPTAHDVPKQIDITIPQEKIIHEPPADSKPHGKAIEKEKDQKEKKDKEEKEKDHKEKDKAKDHKEKEKDHKEKEKDHKEKEKEEIKSKEPLSRHDMHGGKLHKEIKAGVADMVHKLGSSAPSSGHERPAEAGASVITLAGENKGASMKISRAEADGKADAAVGKERRAHKLGVGERKDEAAAGARGLTAYVNSNVQVINNSLLLQSSCTGGDPGVHLKLSTKSKKKNDGEDAGAKSGSAAPKK